MPGLSFILIPSKYAFWKKKLMHCHQYFPNVYLCPLQLEKYDFQTLKQNHP